LDHPEPALYGRIPEGLADTPPHAVQCSPREPGAVPLGLMAPGTCPGIAVHAPASVIERRRVLALALRALAPGAPLVVVAHNTKGGTRLAKELEAFGCDVVSEHKRHHRIVRTTRPEQPQGLEAAIAEGDAIFLPDIELWSQPGLFNWDRIDPGSQLLLDHLPVLTGRGADLGCGIGVLARAVRDRAAGVEMHLIDIDARALDMARRNVPGEGVFLYWSDVRTVSPDGAGTSSAPLAGEKNGGPTMRIATLPAGLDFVVCNPPFHDGGEEDKSLGKLFIARAAEMLRPGGTLWLTSNRHLPYEAVLSSAFEAVELLADRAGFKIHTARKAARAASRGGRRQPGRASSPKARR
jgi:16S rRNA (guanine1207-N2)-methyltransferase